MNALDTHARDLLRKDLVELQTANNVAGEPGSTEVAAEYLEVVATRI
jgi:hypothetical protein